MNSTPYVQSGTAPQLISIAIPLPIKVTLEDRGEKVAEFGPPLPSQRGVSRPISVAWEGQHKPTIVGGDNLHFGCFKALISSSILLATLAGRLYGFSKRSLFVILRKSCLAIETVTCSRRMIAMSWSVTPPG